MAVPKPGQKNEADAFLRENHIDARTVNLPKFYEAYAKQYLAEGMNDETLLSLTRKDVLEALLPKRDRHGSIVFEYPQSPNLPLILDARDQVDYQNGRFATTAFTDNLYDSHIYLLQKKLNEQGATDKFGNRLKEDGVFGPKTQWAMKIKNWARKRLKHQLELVEVGSVALPAQSWGKWAALQSEHLFILPP